MNTSIDEGVLIQEENKPVWRLIFGSTLKIRTFIGYTLMKSVKNLFETQKRGSCIRQMCTICMPFLIEVKLLFQPRLQNAQCNPTF